MLAGVAMMLALVQPATHLTIEPWTGGDFQTTTAAAARYRLKISGRANVVVHLRAAGVAEGWLAAFCTPKVCSPLRVDATIAHSGETIIQFELIRESANAPKRSGATIIGDHGASVKVPAAYRQ